jgi:hypothetical protein
MNFDYAIDCLQERVRLLESNVTEWERENDPHAINKPRADFARNKIKELEAGIELLQKETRK